MSPLGEFVFRADGAAYVVTARAGERRAGCLVGFGCQVSIEPERFLVAISQVNNTHVVAAAADILAVHLIPEAAGDLARLFGEITGDDVDKFGRCRYLDGPGGVPIIEGVSGVLVGRILDRISFGDHTGHLLEPISTTLTDAVGPVYSLAQARHLRPGHPVG